MLRSKAGLPALIDEDDLPDPAYDPNYVTFQFSNESY
jgi:hypothetical protein